jgi:hypothetical protein
MVAGQNIPPHTPVAVRCRFDGSCVEGFAVVDVNRDAPSPYVVRRLHDGAQLPVTFGSEEVRPLLDEQSPAAARSGRGS